MKGRIGSWETKIEQLYSSEDAPLWIEHPILGARADFIALPLTQLGDVEIYPHNLNTPGHDLRIGPADAISVAGFPFGLTGGGVFPIWVTGFIASEPMVDFNELPIQLIDCRSCPGQSGSPVLAYRSGGMLPMSDGGSSVFNGPISKLIGIYSGRINTESDLGMVWKTSAILELLKTIV